MQPPTLIVRLGQQRYRVARPWGDLPAGDGLVTDVACDSRGHVFVLLRYDRFVGATGAAAMVELAPDGSRLAIWCDDRITDAHMLAAGPDDRLYVVDRDAHQIVIFSPEGEKVGSIGNRDRPGEPFSHPCDVAVAPWGDIYVADGYGASQVHRFDANGNLLATWGEPGDGPGQFTTPHAIWALPDERVIVADRENNRLQVFDRDGNCAAIWTDHHKPMDIFADSAGRIYVTDQVPRLSLLSGDGKLIGRCRPVLNGAHGVWGDAAGNLYLAEISPSRVTRLTPTE